MATAWPLNVHRAAPEYERLSVLPNKSGSAALEPDLSRREDFGWFLLRERLRDYALRNFDLTLIDCPPNLGLFSLQAMIASDFILVPVEAGSRYAMDGLDRTVETIDDIAQADTAGNPGRFLRLLINKADRRTAVSQRVHRTDPASLRRTGFQNDHPDQHRHPASRAGAKNRHTPCIQKSRRQRLPDLGRGAAGHLGCGDLLMALSLREKLQKASLATIATNAARRWPSSMSWNGPRPPLGKAPVALSPQAVSDEATQQATQRPSHPPNKRPQQATQRPSNLPSRRPSRGDPATQSGPHRITHPSQRPSHISVSDTTRRPSQSPTQYPGHRRRPVGNPDRTAKKSLAVPRRPPGGQSSATPHRPGRGLPPATVQTICRRLKNLGVLSPTTAAAASSRASAFPWKKRSSKPPCGRTTQSATSQQPTRRTQ